MTSHEIDCRVLGADIQVLEVGLDPQETVMAKATGGVVALEPGIDFSASPARAARNP